MIYPKRLRFRCAEHAPFCPWPRCSVQPLRINLWVKGGTRLAFSGAQFHAPLRDNPLQQLFHFRPDSRFAFQAVRPVLADQLYALRFHIACDHAGKRPPPFITILAPSVNSFSILPLSLPLTQLKNIMELENKKTLA